jgi:hypothetical protein
VVRSGLESSPKAEKAQADEYVARTFFIKRPSDSDFFFVRAAPRLNTSGTTSSLRSVGKVCYPLQNQRRSFQAPRASTSNLLW